MALVLLTITWVERRQARDLQALASYVSLATGQKSRIAIVYFSRSNNMALVAAEPACANELPVTVMGKTSEALVTLATTGNPDPLEAELGGNVMSWEDFQKKVSAPAEPGEK